MTYVRLKDTLKKGGVDRIELKDIKDDEFNQIAQLLDMEINRKSLTSLDASHSQLNSTNLNKLANIAAKCEKLKTLNLSDSKISKGSAARLDEVVSKNKELKMDLTQTTLKEELFNGQVEALMEYPNLSSYLNLKMAEVTEDAQDDSKISSEEVEDDLVEVTINTRC